MEIKNFLVSKGFKQWLKFSGVGAISTPLNLAILFLLTHYFLIHYLVSATIAFLIAIIFSFVAHHNWTFKTKGKIFLRFSKFLSINLIFVFLDLIFLRFLVEHLEWWYLIAQFAALNVLGMSKFIVQKYWTFRE